MFIEVQPGKEKAAAKDMAEEYRIALKNAKAALADRDVTAYEEFRGQMNSFLKMGFSDMTNQRTARVTDYLSFEEIYRPFGIVEIGGRMQ